MSYLPSTQVLLMEIMGAAGIIASGLSLILLVVFCALLVLPGSQPGDRAILVFLVIGCAGGVADRWFVSGALFSAATEIDLSQTEQAYVILARLAVIFCQAGLLWIAYRRVRARGR